MNLEIDQARQLLQAARAPLAEQLRRIDAAIAALTPEKLKAESRKLKAKTPRKPRPVQSPGATVQRPKPELRCPDCGKAFKAHGWLANHRAKAHGRTATEPKTTAPSPQSPPLEGKPSIRQLRAEIARLREDGDLVTAASRLVEIKKRYGAETAEAVSREDES
jgi:hypothetical protein